MTTAKREAEALKLGTFTRSLAHLLSIATRLRSLSMQTTPARFNTSIHNSVLDTFELLAPNSPQFLALAPIIQAAAILG